MDTTTVAGHSSVRGTDENFYRIDPDKLSIIGPLIARVVNAQAAAFLPYYSVEDVLELIANHKWQAYAVTRAEGTEIWGLVFTSLQRLDNGLMVMNIEFSTFQDFYLMAKIYDYLELIAGDLGCEYIQSLTMPTIAEYAVKKKGFSAPYVYVRKAVKAERRN